MGRLEAEKPPRSTKNDGHAPAGLACIVGRTGKPMGATAVRLLRCAGFLIAIVQPSHAAFAADNTRVHPQPCSLEGIRRPTQCARIVVPENWDSPGGRGLELHVAIVQAAGKAPKTDPIVVLMGGPGEDAIASGADYASQFAPLLRERDLVLVDQRGTGGSAALHCKLHEDPASNVQDLFPPASIKQCVESLQAHADLTRYTFQYFAQDLEAVRRALGYARLNLFAGSYGTRAAQTFIRQYPASVRTAYLGSPVPMDSGGPLAFARTAQDALERMVAQCGADPDCRRNYPDVGAALKRVIAQLDAGKAQGRAPDGRTMTLNRGRVVEWMRSKLYRPQESVSLPWFIREADAGNWNPIVEALLDGAKEMDEALSWGLFFAITCSEDLPFLSEADIVRASQGTYLGDYRIRQQQAACQYFPRSSLPDGYRLPVVSKVPTLLVTGDADGGTPRSFMDRLAVGFSERATLTMQGQGHTEWNPCLSERYTKLVNTGSIRGLDQACPAVTWPHVRPRAWAQDSPRAR